MSSSQTGTSCSSERQKLWFSPRFEVLERHALLLDPGEVAEVEDPAPVAVGALEEVVVACAEDVLAEDLRRRPTSSKPSGQSRSSAFVELALVEAPRRRSRS